MSCELPQCSHVFWGMDNYSPLGIIDDLPYRLAKGKFRDKRLWAVARGVKASLTGGNVLRVVLPAFLEPLRN
jgi:hypothetical protein